MAKFMKPTQYKQPSETPAVQPQEQPDFPHNAEHAVAKPSETPATAPREICGINGCTTWYDNPVIMKRHRERQHGIGVKNLNQPKPRNENIKLS